MKQVAGILFLDLQDMERSGVKPKTVIMAKKRKSNGWDFIQDPADRRKVLVQFSTLKDRYQQMVVAKFGDPEQYHINNKFKGILTPVKSAVNTLREYRLPDGTALSDNYLAKYSKACSVLELMASINRTQIKALGFANKQQFSQALIQLIKIERIALPSSYSKLRIKLNEYKEHGAEALITKCFGNNNSRKITAEIGEWLVAQYALPIKQDVAQVTIEYLATANKNGWPTLTEQAIHAHLHLPINQQLWWMGRHGKHSWQAKFGHTLKMLMPTCREALWCSDGTKLNFFYQEDGKVKADLYMYIVMDVYSDMILGFDVDRTENYLTVSKSFKMALKLSKFKPSQLLYDAGGAHRKLEMQDFFKRATDLHFNAQPYNAQAKPVEGLIGRFQKQVMRNKWFFTGQNITAKSLNSRPNMEHIMANKDKLPTKQEVITLLPELVQQWNNSKHPRLDGSRADVYAASVNEKATPLNFIDMVDLFWHTTQKPIHYGKAGLVMEQQYIKYHFEVYDLAGQPDMDFRTHYINTKFYVKYDPEDLSMIRLYRKVGEELRPVATATKKHEYARAVIDKKPGETTQLNQELELRKSEAARVKAELKAIRNTTGIDPETLVELGFLGPKEGMNTGEGAVLTEGFNNGNDEEDPDPLDFL